MPTKRIVRTLTTESSGGGRLKYEKELLNSRKKAIFTKRIIPASLMLSPPYPLRVFACHPERSEGSQDEAISPLYVFARHNSAEAVSVDPFVFARHDSAEAISVGVSRA
jgi:hypothetical protein